MEQINFNKLLANENEKKLDLKYLLQINRIKLIDYVQHGLILPDKYLGDECESDIQSKNKNFLVLSDGYVEQLDEFQILIEVIFTNNEKEKLHQVDELFYSDKPIPLSRIKKIYVQDKDIITHIKTSIANSDCGFLPDELFDLYKIRSKIKFYKKNYLSLSEDMIVTDYTKQISKYDKRMGMFSFMKNTNLYFCNQIGIASNYSNHYFSALSLLLEEKLDDKPFELFDILGKNKEFKKLLYSDTQIDKEFLKKIAETIENIEIKNIFLELLKPIGGREILSTLLEKGALNLYLIGLVYYFRQKNANRKDNFKIEIDELIPYKVAETSLAILGIYLGYKNIRANETIEIENKEFKKIFGSKVAMKFTMESKLDYITLEMIYNICFYGDDYKGYEYDYLDYPKKLKLLPNISNKRWYVLESDEIYFGQQYVKITKNSFEKIIDEKFEKLPEELSSSKNGVLIGYVLQKFPSIISPIKFGEKLEISCKKDVFQEKILEEQNSKKQDNIIDLFEISGLA